LAVKDSVITVLVDETRSMLIVYFFSLDARDMAQDEIEYLLPSHNPRDLIYSRDEQNDALARFPECQKHG
jgi:hypothetical protein